MNLRLLRVFLSLVAFLGVFLAPELAAQTTGATLFGRVVDADGGTLPGVTITATNSATGISRTAITASDGSFRFPVLPAGNYTITAELAGFGTVTASEVTLNVATPRELDITLRPASVQESITVTAEAPLIETTPSIGTVVSQTELEGLPLNGRQFANLASLAPGTSLGVNTDPTKPGQLVVALNGGTGRNVNYIIDGGDNTDDTIGGALQNFNLEAVQEFKIQTMQYKAEFGRSTGGVLTVVTKTGTNDMGGSAYGFFREDGLNEKTESESRAGAPKSAYERQTYGASLGGPIIRDRAHYFATYEKSARDTNYIIDTGGIFSEFDGDAIPLAFEDELITAKGTLNLSAAQYLQVRYGFQKNSDKYGASPLVLPSALGTITNDYESVLGGHNWQLGGDRVNEFVVQWTRFDNFISSDSTDPALAFPSGVVIGESVNTPQSTHQEKAQFKDDFSWGATMGGRRHDFKTGLNYIHEPILGGDFTTGTSGQYTLKEDRLDSPVTDIVIFGGFAAFDTPIDQFNIYFQDDWYLSDRLTLNLGLRYDFWDGFDIDQRSNVIWQALSTQTTFSEPYLRDFQGGKGGKLENDDDNWGPRLGLTYDVLGNGRHIVRGGWGTFYDFPYTNATILFPVEVVQSTYGVIFQHTNPQGIRNPNGTFFRPGVDPLPTNQAPPLQRPLPNEVASPTIATPYANQLSLGYSWQVNNWLGLNFEAVSIDYKDIPFRFRANPFLDAQGRPQATRRFPQFGNFRLWHGDGEATYDGVNIGFRARVRNRLEMQGFYTWSEAEGNILAGADEFRITGSDFQSDTHRAARDTSINPLNPWCSACFGPLYSDARHRVTFSAVYQLPWDINLAGVFRYQSALPYTKADPELRDLNGDGFRNDLAAGVDHVNSERGESFSQFDVRLSKEFGFGGDLGLELIAEIFNLLDEDNPARPNRLGVPTTFAGDPGRGEQRLGQLGLRVRF